MKTRPPNFRGIRHIAFRVKNLEECEIFYTDVMGMKLLNRANDNLVYLTCGNDNLSLARSDSEPNDGGVFDHYGFIVESKESVDAWHDYFKSINVPVIDQPHDHRTERAVSTSRTRLETSSNQSTTRQFPLSSLPKFTSTFDIISSQ